MPTTTGPIALADPYVMAASGVNDWPAVLVQVYRFAGGTMNPLPNVQAIAAVTREGADPGTCLFRYDLTWPDARAPHTPEEAVTGGMAWAVAPGDRLCVKTTRADSTTEWVFDGEMLRLDMEIDGKTESVFMTASGIAKRLWDTPVGGALMRDADLPETDHNAQTDRVAQFNPRGEPNASPDPRSGPAPAGGVDKQYRVFLDPLLVRDPDVREFWTLAEAARHLCFVYNDETYVNNPDGTVLDSLLVNKTPSGDLPFDPGDATTYTTAPITVPDTPVKGRDWPVLLWDLIRDYGFGFRFKLTTDPTTHLPVNAVDLYQQQSAHQKPVLIQARGSALDRNATNCHTARVTRDLGDVANAWTVEGDFEEYEATFVLACGFPMAAGDAATTNLYDKTDPTYTAANQDKYRLYVFDETGEGHYTPGSATPSYTVPSLDLLFGAPVGGVRQYAKNRRVPVGKLLTLDLNQKPQRAMLHVSRDYAGPKPGLWDGTGTWQKVKGFELLKDRLGVRISPDNPERWNVGRSRTTGAPYPMGVIRAVSAQATGTPPNFFLRLTCVVKADLRLNATADRRSASPIPRTITRTVDAHDRLKHQVVTAHSQFNTAGADSILRDDTPKALAEAQAIRYQTEAGLLDAEFVIDHLTTAYEVSDRIQKIQGRETPLRTDEGLAGENPLLPVVIERTLRFWPEQETHLRCSDAGTGRANYRHQVKNKRGARI